MYLVTGATGNIGAALVRSLQERGQDVRAFVRDRDGAGRLPAGVDIAVGDLDDPASVADAVKDVDGVFHMQVDHGTEQTATMIEAARAAGVRKLVALSSIGARLIPRPTMGTWFEHREELLRHSGLDVTYLRPNALMPNALAWARAIREGDKVMDPCGPGRMACVDTDDVARVAAVTLTEDGHAGHGYILTGPEALTTREQVAIIADIVGRDIEFQDTTPEQFARESIESGTPVEAARTMENLNELFRAGRSGIVTDDVWNLTGGAPRTFRDWCERHAEAFCPT